MVTFLKNETYGYGSWYPVVTWLEFSFKDSIFLKNTHFLSKKSLKINIYCIRPNYCTYPYKRTVKKFCSLQITTSVLFYLLLYKGICCGYSFELHRQVDAIQMSTYMP